MGGAGGGGGAGITSVLYSMTQDGRFTEDITAKSEDGKAELFIPEDTIGKNRLGSLLSSITMFVMPESDSPSPPNLFKIIGVVYDIGPNGATFNPPITLSISYDASLIPEGVAEKNLVVGRWSKAMGRWEELKSAVDSENDTVVVDVDHFTAFATLAYVQPAGFALSNLSIAPAEVGFGEEVTISVTVTNTGGLSGSYQVSLKIDDVVAQTKEVTLEGGDSGTLSFSLTADSAGEHTVNVGDSQGTFRVKEAPAAPRAPAAFTASALTISPAEVNIGERVAISLTVTNTGEAAGTHRVMLRINGALVETKEVTITRGASEKVTFTVVENTSGDYSVDVDGLTGAFVVRERVTPVPAPPPSPAPTPAPAPAPEAPAKPFDWWLIVRIVAGIIIVAIVVFIFVRRSR